MRSEPAPQGRAQPELALAFTGTPLAVREVLVEVMSALDPLALEPEERGSVELVLAEVLNNVVEHAYSGRSDGPVHLACRCEGDGLRVTIRDEGLPMPAVKAPLEAISDGTRARIEAAEGGFGWFIIRDIAHDIAYRRDKAENVLSFRIAVGLGVALN